MEFTPAHQLAHDIELNFPIFSSEFGLPASAFRLRPSGFGLPTSAFRLRPSGFVLPASAFRTFSLGLSVLAFQPRPSALVFRFRPSGFGLPTRAYRKALAGRPNPEGRMPTSNQEVRIRKTKFGRPAQKILVTKLKLGYLFRKI